MSNKKHYNIRDSYKDYLETTNDPIEESLYVFIIKQYMLFLSDKLLEEGSITLPSLLGKFEIRGTVLKPRFEEGKIKGLAPDWGETNKLWNRDEEARINKTIVYHFNEDTNSTRYRLYWRKKNVLVSNKSIYDFRLTRSNKRKLSKMIKEGKEYLINV